MPNHKYRVAVYGTLRKGEPNHYILADSRYIGFDVIKATMYSLGGFPCIKLHDDPNGPDVYIEIYECDKHTLAKMDHLEGVDHGMYRRVSIHTVYGKVYVYEWEGLVHRYPVVECGDWKKRNDGYALEEEERNKRIQDD